MSDNVLLSSQTRQSITELDSLQEILRSPQCQHRADIASFDAREQCHRLTLWANNIGALQRPGKRTSLDHRLREAPQVRQQIGRLLGRLTESAQRASSICQGHLPNRVEDDSDLECESSSEQHEGETLLAGGISELKELCLSIVGSITRLFKLSMIIRNPTPRDRYAKLASIKTLDSRYDISHVKEKFAPTVQNLWLAERLGKANAQRRDYFRYRRKHEEKLAEEREEHWKRQAEAEDYEVETEAQIVLPRRPAESSLGSTKASTFVQGPAIETKAEDMDENSDTGASETSFATSVEESDAKALRVPQMPSAAGTEEPFICPYCFLVQTPMSRRAWKQHVYSDLQPYVCTFEQCTAKSFTSRREWFDHELRLHRKEWLCSLCEASAFHSSTSFRSHLRQKHGKEVTDRQLEGMVELCSEPLDKLDPIDCPLCDHWAKVIREREISLNPAANETTTIVVTPKQFRRHLAGHLEQLALFSLPRSNDADDSNGGSNEADFDAGSDLASVQSHSSVATEEESTEGVEHTKEQEVIQQEANASELVRQFATIRGRQVDITGLDVDPDYIKYLPEYLQDEVIMEKYFEHCEAAGENREKFHAVNPEFLNSLPDDLREEIRRQEAHQESHRQREEADRQAQQSTDMSRPKETDVSKTDEFIRGRADITIAAVKDRELEVVAALLDEGVNVNTCDEDGNTLLQNAMYANSFEIVNLLLENGADPDLWSQDTFPLRTCVMSNRVNLVRTLLSHGADPNQHDYVGSTPLHYAAAIGAIDLIQMLYEYGADFEVKNARGETPIMIAQAVTHVGATDAMEFFRKRATDNNHSDKRSLEELEQSSELERITLNVQRRWRKLHLERYLPLEPGTLRSFQEVAWIVVKLNRKTQRETDRNSTMFPSDPTVLEKIWGRLFTDSGQATLRFNQFLRGLAKYLIEEYEPRNSIVIGPEKITKLYKDFQVHGDSWSWAFLFDDNTSSISRLLREMEVEHHLVQGNDLGRRPDVPALTPNGFAQWFELMLRIRPDVEFFRLSSIVSQYPISDPDSADAEERYPKDLSPRLLPTLADDILLTKFVSAVEVHCGLRLSTKVNTATRIFRGLSLVDTASTGWRTANL